MQFLMVRSHHEIHFLQGLWQCGCLTVLVQAPIGDPFFIPLSCLEYNIADHYYGIFSLTLAGNASLAADSVDFFLLSCLTDESVALL